ncbi:MAG: nucleoside triphosphate pyrophosphohydrolase [Anaerolineae bacterium]|nr:nucleoside triphosphate pyrophosphohydrolase [Anaerolineae bacterium]
MPPGVTIVGLGPGDIQQLTLEAWQVIESAPEIYLRTRHHPAVKGLPQGKAYHSFDAIYEEKETFAEVYEEIAQRIIALGRRPEGVIYAVPGHPLVGESSVLRILALAKEEGLPTRVVGGLSFLEPTFAALGIDPFDGLQVCDATTLAQRHHPLLDPDVAALVAQLYNRELAAEVKLTLMNLYHDDHPIKLVRHAGMPEEEVRELALYQLDRQEGLDHLTSLYIPPLPKPGSLSSYQDVVARLRAPDGCPWDRQQTHCSLRPHLLEETYEVLAALDADDMEALKEELGDLLLQVFLHAQIACEEGDFKLIDSVQHAIAKLIRRHPHVFGDRHVRDAQEVLRNWEQIKREEKNQEGGFHSMLEGINKALPALSQAMEIQRRVARVGFDWPEAKPVAAKVLEELQEFRQASNEEEQANELGDLLFSLVNLARWYNIDPESALREANQRFMRRFAAIERRAAELGKTLEEMSLSEMDALWEEAKGEEGQG